MQIKKLFKNAHKQIKKKSQKWDFKRYKITAYLKTPIFINNNLYADGFLHHASCRHWLGRNYYNLTINESKEFGLSSIKLPIMESRGSYLASKIIFESKKTFTSHWRKRFDEMQALKYAKQKNVNTVSGKYKAYNMPIQLELVEKAEFIVVADLKCLIKLLQRIKNLGKKTNLGFGKIEKWTIEETEQEAKRSFEVPNQKVKSWMKEIYYGRAKPSYHNPSDLKLCYIDKM
jgi:CRISPR type IV-associated protein Csf3